MRTFVAFFVGLIIWTPLVHATELSVACTLNSAAPIPVEDILKDYKPFLNKCVRVRGFVALRRLYDNLRSFYSEGNGTWTLPPPGYIALYGSSSISQDWFWNYRARATIVGTVSACNLIDTTPTAPNQLVMVIGECHYKDGPLIQTTEVHADSHIESRLFGRRAYAEYGSLQPVKDNQIAPSRRRLIQSWFEAIAAQDKHKMKALLRWDFPDRDGELTDAVNAARSPYWFLIGRKNLPKVQYFLTTDSMPSQRDTVGCMCVVGDCRGHWPIVEVDAFPREGWPYICAELYPAGDIDF